MFGFCRSLAAAVAAASVLVAAVSVAQAAGAFAVGACGAYGYAFDYKEAAAARKCSGACRIVGALRRGCAALAVDAKRPCGSFGWAINTHLGQAQNTSLRRCYQYGGHDCVVRAWACDEKG
jgi:Domain of unknown function (DUF4189)